MRIAVVGTGVSGLVAAWMLHRDAELTVFEAGDSAGGHCNTVSVNQGARDYAVDTGFIVYNEKTYPNFVRLLAMLGVKTQPSNMSFSVRCERSGIEYSSSGRGVFAQRRNLLRPAFLRMLRDIVRFHRRARHAVTHLDSELTLEDFIRAENYSRGFRTWYLAPMLAAIWSADPERVFDFPARHFLRFFDNHGLLTATKKIQWRTIAGGSREYVHRIVEPWGDRLSLRTPVRLIERDATGVTLRLQNGSSERFDEVIIATHSDQALQMLAAPTDAERQILGSILYLQNEAALHTDTELLPRRERAWASWNYFIPKHRRPRPVLTYNMNQLQNLDASQPLLVTLNRTTQIDMEKIIRVIRYEHPVYNAAAIRAQQRWQEISGHNRTHYCGAYWGYGFHEDGVNSGLAVARAFGREF